MLFFDVKVCPSLDTEEVRYSDIVSYQNILYNTYLSKNECIHKQNR